MAKTQKRRLSETLSGSLERDDIRWRTKHLALSKALAVELRIRERLASPLAVAV